MRRRVRAALGTAALLFLALTGCTSAGDMTCEEFGALSDSDRSDVLEDLLVEHRLDPLAVSNLVGVGTAVHTFCGTSAIAGMIGEPDPARTNLDRPLDEAVDWDSDTW